jgi:hypothetical protein
MAPDKEARKLFVRTILDYQRCFTVLAAYDTELRARFGRDWLTSLRQKVESLTEHPAAKEAAGQHFAHPMELALEGLDEASAQELIDCVQNSRLETERQESN